MVWFRQLRLDQIWIKTTFCPKILRMLANKLIKPVCGSGAEIICNFLGTSDPDPKYPFLEVVGVKLVLSVKNEPNLD
jgi:hypothetical protein